MAVAAVKVESFIGDKIANRAMPYANKNTANTNTKYSKSVTYKTEYS